MGAKVYIDPPQMPETPDGQRMYVYVAAYGVAFLLSLMVGFLGNFDWETDLLVAALLFVATWKLLQWFAPKVNVTPPDDHD